MPRLRSVLGWLIGALLVVPLLAATLLAVLVLLRVPAAEPLVQREPVIEVADVERALRLARQHDPRHALPGVVRTLRLSQHEAELLINHTAARWRPSRWQLELGAGDLQLRGSLPLPRNPFGGWLNVELQARQTRELPRLVHLRLGRLEVPPALAAWAAERLLAHYGLEGWRQASVLSVQLVRLLPRRLDLVYAWGPDAGSQVLAALLPESEHARLRVYAAELAQVANALPAGAPQSLSQLLPPMFELARRRSAAGQDPALENRAALLVLGMVANGISLAALLPERREELAAHPIRVTLAGRPDSPQHFLVSATLAAESGTPLADLIGLYKELSDARSGSGFSFNDMAANRAGTRMGALAVGDPARLQQRLAAGLNEADFMPDVSDLPEGMNEAEFRRRFGAPGTAAYQRMMEDIEQRLGAAPLYRSSD
ncbi:MAG: YfiM family protein [Proteobacteria bacterium]|nr:YfiM family protein [Pseudomonadota bacterium]